MPCDEDRDRNYAATSQEIQSIAVNNQKLRTGKETFFPRDFRMSMALLTP